jgi:serine/threonine protein kinase
VLRKRRFMTAVSDLAGQTVGNYVIRGLIGEGGMGAVYLAEHRRLGRKAAVKVLKRERAADRAVLTRFQEEARAASQVSHPGIVHIYDVGTLPDGLPYIVMELLEGESLGRRLTDGAPMPIDEALDIAAQAASALEAVHGRGIVHRDLKPDNLFLTPDPVAPMGVRVKVLDFGVAKLRGQVSLAGARTQEGTLLGTPLYMSPEQCRGLPSIDQRSDIYALGLILYQMLVGEPPFNAPSFGDLIIQHVSRPPPQFPPDLEIPERIEATVMIALAKSPDDRFPSMTDFLVALQSATGATQMLPVVGRPAELPVTRASVRPPSDAYDSLGPRSPTSTLSSAVTNSEARESGGRVPWVPISIGLLVVGALAFSWWFTVGHAGAPTAASRRPAATRQPARSPAAAAPPALLQKAAAPAPDDRSATRPARTKPVSPFLDPGAAPRTPPMQRPPSPFLDEEPDPPVTAPAQAGRPTGVESPAQDPAGPQPAAIGPAVVGPLAPPAWTPATGATEQPRAPGATPQDASKGRPPTGTKRPKIKSEYW